MYPALTLCIQRTTNLQLVAMLLDSSQWPMQLFVWIVRNFARRSSAITKTSRMVDQMSMKSGLYRLCMPSSTAPDETGSCLRETLFRALTCSSSHSRNATNFNLLDRLKCFLAARAACISQRICEALELYNQSIRMEVFMWLLILIKSFVSRHGKIGSSWCDSRCLSHRRPSKFLAVSREGPSE